MVEESCPIYIPLQLYANSLGLMFSRFLYFLSCSIYWLIYKQTGVSQLELNIINYYLVVVIDCAYLYILYFIGNGWKILRSNVSRSELRSSLISFVMLITVYWFISISLGKKYSYLNIVVIYLYLFPRLLGSISKTQELVLSLNNFVSSYRGQSDHALSSNLEVIEVIYLKLENMARAYIAVIVCLELIKLFPKISFIAFEPSSLLCYVSLIYICWLLSPCRYNSEHVFFSDIRDEISDFVRDHLDLSDEESEMELWDIQTTFVIDLPYDTGYVLAVEEDYATINFDYETL
eukprot:TRINITY_DN3229_c0_g1_i2.p1 TRINITY_DN3229_c0_g1~~TRINITY_DN3229_c0_g1_i2.p1  ORF type:complete len:291 (-),score=36.82 TRINITY_DN3229_c0_g1_i2:25-897(-)